MLTTRVHFCCLSVWPLNINGSKGVLHVPLVALVNKLIMLDKPQLLMPVWGSYDIYSCLLFQTSPAGTQAGFCPDAKLTRSTSPRRLAPLQRRSSLTNYEWKALYQNAFSKTEMVSMASICNGPKNEAGIVQE